MRKNRFLLNLIAATAIGMSVFGCDSSSSGGIADTTDISQNGNQQAAERRNLREYLVLGQRGLSTPFAVNLGPGQSAPGNPPGDIIAGGTGDDVVDDGRAQLYEIFGIANVPQPNANLLGPGGDSTDPNVPEAGEDAGNAGTTGFHGIYADPGGTYVIGVSRAKNRGGAGDTLGGVTGAQMQIFQMDIEEPLDQAFPPNIVFGTTFDPLPIQVFAPNQGLFVSGAWSPNGLNFYLGISQSVRVNSIDRATGRIDGQQVLPFPAGPSGTNNPVKLLATDDGQFLYGIDNANNQIIRYGRDATDGTLTNLGSTPTVTDPRGATIDRSGNFMYVVGRSSGLLGGFRIEADGSLTPIEVFAGFGNIAIAFGIPLGDIDANPQTDQVFLGTYSGALQGYNVDVATGQLSISGAGGLTLGNARNTTNVEVEPTGRFVFTVQEHDFEELQDYVTAANGFAVPEDEIFANLITGTNETAAGTFSLTPQADANGRTVFALPQTIANAFQGDLEVFRINANGSVRAEARVAADNPYGLDFFQRVIIPPAGVPDDGSQGDVPAPDPSDNPELGD